MIHAEGLTLQYPTKEEPALDDVSLRVDQGDVLGVVGPVESGKTSLAMAIAGLAPDVTGGRLDGEFEVAGRDPRDADDTRVGMVFEDYSAQLTQVKVLDEIVVPLLDRGFDREAAHERAHELLERVRLDGYGDRWTWELSGGEQQRVAIAAVLALDPDVLVFDTATDMLDPEGREDVWNLVASLAGETTMVVTVDDPHELVGVADRAVVLEDGEVQRTGDADDVLRDLALFERIGVRPPLPLRLARDLDLEATPLTREEFVDALGPVHDTNAPTRGGDASERTAVGETGAGRIMERLTPDGSNEDPPDPVLALDDVSFGYSASDRAIDGVDLSVHEGEVHAVIGGNGAGKTTLTELVVGLLSPDSGRITVDDESTLNRTAADIGESVGLAFQNPDRQLSRRTVEKELRYPLEQRRYDRSGWLPFAKTERFGEPYIEERVEHVLSLTGLDDEDVRDEDPTKLPQGLRRLVAIAAAIAPDPSVAVFDEPTAGLDADGYDRIRRTIERLQAEGTGVVLVEHDMDFVCEVADRVTLLDDGSVALQGSPRQVFARDNWDELRERYLRPPRAARLSARLGIDALTADRLLEQTRGIVEAPS